MAKRKVPTKQTKPPQKVTTRTITRKPTLSDTKQTTLQIDLGDRTDFKEPMGAYLLIRPVTLLNEPRSGLTGRL